MSGPLLVTFLALWQASGHDAPPGGASFRPKELNGAGVEQKLGTGVPLDAAFKDHTGADVKLGRYFDGRPVVLVLAYLRCPTLCSEVLNGTFDALLRSGLSPDQYEIVVASFDARETPEMARTKREHYLEHFARPGLERHVHFLTGRQESITALCDAVGFAYGYDAKSDQFAHPGMVTVLTPGGKIARYFFGVRFPPRDLRLGLVEASEGRIGSPTDTFLLYCLYYDPNGATYAASVLRIVRLAGAATVLLIVVSVAAAFWRERRRRLRAAADPTAPLSEVER